MKNLLIALLITITTNCFGQSMDPVKWNYCFKKIKVNTFEIHLSATIDKGWHIYAQSQPKDAIAYPTTISFSKNPLVIHVGQAKEIGRKEKQRLQELDITQYYYSGQVDFVQAVQLKSNVKTNVIGSIVFMACTDKECLPLKTVSFSIPIGQ